MTQIEKMQIKAEGENNVKLLFVSVMLGMLDMIEKGNVSVTDAAMIFCLPIMLRTKDNTIVHQICSMTDELDTYPPMRRKGEIEKIRKLCCEIMADYRRTDNEAKDQTISFEFFHGNMAD